LNESLPIPNRTETISISRLLIAWFHIGWQSFGGGTSTLSLIQRTFVLQHGWLSDDELVRINAISQIAPGINILSITIQIGRQLGGAAGIAASLFGLLLPSCAVTVLMAAGFASIERIPTVQAAIRGITPATIGIGILSAASMVRAQLRESKAIGGAWEVVVALFVLAASGSAVALHAPVIAVLCGGGIVMALARWASPAGRRLAATPSHESESAALGIEEAQEER
jgi:chromate transporter